MEIKTTEIKTTQDMDGNPIVIGDTVSFSHGGERSGKIKAIRSDWIDVEVYDSETCETSIIPMAARRAWKE